MVAMSENDSIPSLENLINDKAAWLYFCPWYMNYLTSEQNNPVDNLIEIYQSDYCITLDELPDLKTYPIKESGEKVEPTPAIDFIPGDATGDKKVNVADFIAMKNSLVEMKNSDIPTLIVPTAFAYDVTGDGYFKIDDAVTLSKFLTGQKVKLTYYKGK